MWSVRFVGLGRELGHCFTLVGRNCLTTVSNYVEALYLMEISAGSYTSLRFSSTRTSGSILKADQYILPIDQQFTESLVLISFCLK